MARFFATWATWEKLVFILACAIFVTLLSGIAKLGYTHCRLRNDAAIAEQEKRESGMQRQMSTRRRKETTEGAESPFGIRAIESGIEVDGVWISRDNTPELASRDISAASSVWDHLPREEFDIEKMEMQQPRNQPGCNTTTAIAQPNSSAFEHAAYAERLPSIVNTSRDPSPIAKPTKSKHSPSSSTKLSVKPYLLRRNSTTNTLRGIDAVFHAVGPMRNDYLREGSSGSNESSNQSTYDSADTEPTSAFALDLLNQQTRRQNSSRDFDLMHSHRMSQAAETGQFGPRARRHGQSGEWTSTANANDKLMSADYFSKPQESSDSPTEHFPGGNTFSTPRIEALPAALRRSSLPDVTPFAKFCQTAPSTPYPDEPLSISIDGLPRSRVRSHSSGVYTSAAASPSVIAHGAELPATETPNEPSSWESSQSSPTKCGSFEHRKSDVIRGHGSGFEILRPGSLTARPPISLHNNAPRRRSSSADSRKKLQKKRQPSVDSQRSADTGHRH